MPPVLLNVTQLGHLTASRRTSCVSVPTVDGHRAGFLLVGVRAAPLSLPPWRWARSDPEGRLVLPRAEDEGPPMNIGMAEVHSWLPGQLFVGTFENRALSPSAIVGCVRMASRNPTHRELAVPHRFHPPRVDAGEKVRMGDKMRVERSLIDDLATRDVNQDCVLLHQAQLAGIDHSLGGGRQRGADDQDIGDAQHLVE